MSLHKRETKHSKHSFGGKEPNIPYNKQQFFQRGDEHLGHFIEKLKRSPELRKDFISKAVRYWNQASTAEKTVICIIVGALFVCSTSLMFWIMTRLSFANQNSVSAVKLNNYPSNGLTTAERKWVGQRIKSITTVNPSVVAAAPKFLGKGASGYIQRLNTYKDFVVNSLDDAVISKVHKDVLAQKDIKIHITTKQGMEGYSAFIKPRILIADQSYQDKEEIITSTINELHSAAISYRNQELGCPVTQTNLDDEPYCEKSTQQYSEEKAKDLKKAIDDGCDMIQQLFKVSKKISNRQPLSDSEQEFYDRSHSAINEYVPQSESTTYTHSVYNQLSPYIKNVPNTDGYDKVLPKDIAQKFHAGQIYGDMYIKVLSNDNDGVNVKYQFGSSANSHSKITALASLVNTHMTLVFGNDSPYFKINPSLTYLAAEMASFIDSYPTSIKANFFSQFCDFFSRYFEVDYCNTALKL